MEPVYGCAGHKTGLNQIGRNIQTWVFQTHDRNRKHEQMLTWINSQEARYINKMKVRANSRYWWQVCVSQKKKVRNGFMTLVEN
jgi:hypothetical protein